MPYVPSLVHAKWNQAAPTNQSRQGKPAKTHPSYQAGLMVEFSRTGLPTVLTTDHTALVLQQRDRSPWGDSWVGLWNGFSNVVGLSNVVAALLLTHRICCRRKLESESFEWAS